MSELSEAEKAAKITVFGFDTAPDILETADRIAIRATEIALLSSELLGMVTQ